MSGRIFFTPEEGWVGDIIPFEENGTFKLFFLHERRENPREGMSWRLVTTQDLREYRDQGDALLHGSPQSPDFNAYTGSVVVDGEGVHHLFYTGQNPRNLGADGLPLQLVMHAISHDGMRHWDKRPQDTFGAPEAYESADWRDPFVFYDERSGLWRMLLAARDKTGPSRRRGLTAQCVSKDLQRWEYAEPFWAPERFITHECPEVFRWGQWWYLVYSEFSDAFATRYRMSRDRLGPWRAPDADTVDGRGFYAAKTAERQGRRFFFGWIPTRKGSSDDGAYEWAGSMSVLEARQRQDGTLAFSIPREILGSFNEQGEELLSAEGLLLGREDGYASHMLSGDIPATCRISVGFTVGADRADAGVIIHASADGDSGHILRVEPKRGRMVIDRWPRLRTGDEQWQISGDVPYLLELERPCDLSEGHHELNIVMEDDIFVACLDDEVTVSCRMEQSWGNALGVFSNDGRTSFDTVVAHAYPVGDAIPSDTGACPRRSETDAGTEGAADVNAPLHPDIRNDELAGGAVMS
ncbi:MAG: hypothetical protein ABF792_04910 [Bifidobacterium psychraerophilum]|uniref:hypothetical protein n=1 Tax=Bifidobacterium psychraerophilum TaxID=218140 RepID=UPI0039E9264B